MCTSAVVTLECSKDRFFSQSSQKNRKIHCIGFSALGEIDLLYELPIAQNKMLCSEDMKAAKESRKAALVLFGECLAFHLPGKETGLIASCQVL